MPKTPPRRLWAILGIYLLGIFMGAVDTGIVTPARTVIQNDLGVDDQTGIWMITIYTLAYAASIPVMGKLADRFGRKPIYLVSIALFGVGSLLCGLSQDLGSFELLILARAVQAVGGGGIVPIANAEFGTSVPESKRGLALGLVGGVYGVANIFGASFGSLILDIAGAENWQYIFYINVPISIGIIVAGLIYLPNQRVTEVKKIDVLGNFLLVSAILMLLLGLRNIDFFDFAASLSTNDVYPYLLGFAVLLPLFVLAERRAEDPVLNLTYFTDFAIGVTLLLAMVTGVILMGTIFVPQFAENATRLPAGSGGYYVIILGVFAGVGAPLSGRMVDAVGPKKVLGLGLALSAVSAAAIVWWAIPQPGVVSVVTSLALCGLGLGFTVGSALNYMMLGRTDDAEATSALATLSLVRSIGTAVAPAVLVGFLAQAGTTLQPALTSLLPTSISAPALPYAAQLRAKLAELKADDEFAAKLGDFEFPDLAEGNTIVIDADGGDGSLPDDLVELLRTADVTTITERTKTVAARMFEEQTPGIIADITDGVDAGIAGLDSGLKELSATDAKMTRSIRKMTRGINGMSEGVAGLDMAIAGTTKAIAGMTKAIAGMDQGIAGQRTALAKLRELKEQLEAVPADGSTMPPGSTGGEPSPPPDNLLEMLPPSVQASLPASVRRELAGLKDLAALDRRIASLKRGVESLAAERATVKRQLTTTRTERAQAESSRADLIEDRAELAEARTDLRGARRDLRETIGDLTETRRQMVVLRAAVPGAFETAKADYLKAIEDRDQELQQAFQATINQGFRGIYLFILFTSLLGLVLVAIYPSKPPA